MEDLKTGRRKQSNPKQLSADKKFDSSVTESNPEQNSAISPSPSGEVECERSDKSLSRQENSAAMTGEDYHPAQDAPGKNRSKVQAPLKEAAISVHDVEHVEKSNSKPARKYQCDACGRLLSTSTSLERHMLTHTGQRPFPCPECPICFTTNGNLLRHIKSCHESIYSACAPRKSGFTEDVSSMIHPAFNALMSAQDLSGGNLQVASPSVGEMSFEDEHSDERPGSEIGDGTQDADKYKPFLCTLCDKVFSTRTNCERHIRNRHSEKNYSRQDFVRLIKFIPKNPNDSHAICKYCKKDFVSSKMLKHHLRSPYSSCRRKPFACQLCQATFSTRNNCIRHITNLHPERKTDYKSLIVLNAPVPSSDTDYQDMMDEDGSPPTMAILSPLSHPFSGRSSSLAEEPIDDSEESYSDSGYSPEHHYSFPSMDGGMDFEFSPLDLTVSQPLDLSVRRSGEPREIRSSPTSWISRVKQQCLPSMPDSGIVKKKKKFQSIGSLMERAVPLKLASIDRTSDQKTKELMQSLPSMALKPTQPINERPAKRPRPYVCQYCGIGFTIRGNMYRHFRHKHPEHVSKRRQKKQPIPEEAAKKIDDVLDSVVNTALSPERAHSSSDHSHPAEIKRELSSEEEEEPVRKLEIDDRRSSFAEEEDTHRSERGKSSDGEGEHSAQSNPDSEGKKGNAYSLSPHNHVCSECGRKFPWQSSLERHMYTHTGQKPYSCPWCDLKFSIKSNCERHCLRIHGKTFNNARKESKSQDKSVECPICHESFAFKINCERHCLEMHHRHYDDIMEAERRSSSLSLPTMAGFLQEMTAKRFQCGKCSLKFETDEDLHMHDENNHGSDVEFEDDRSEASFSGNLVVDA